MLPLFCLSLLTDNVVSLALYSPSPSPFPFASTSHTPRSIDTSVHPSILPSFHAFRTSTHPHIRRPSIQNHHRYYSPRNHNPLLFVDCGEKGGKEKERRETRGENGKGKKKKNRFRRSGKSKRARCVGFGGFGGYQFSAALFLFLYLHKCHLERLLFNQLAFGFGGDFKALL